MSLGSCIANNGPFVGRPYIGNVTIPAKVDFFAVCGADSQWLHPVDRGQRGSFVIFQVCFSIFWIGAAFGVISAEQFFHSFIIVAHCLGDFNNRVFVSCKAAVELEEPVSVTVKSCPQFQFDAGVFHLSHDFFVGSESGRGRDGIIGYQVDGTLVVGRGFQIDFIVPQSDFNSIVEGVFTFPFQVRISHLIEEYTVACGIPAVCLQLIHIFGRIEGEVGLSGQSVGGTELQHGEEFVRLHKIIIMNVDSCSCWPEHGPSFIGTEFGRTVDTSCKVGEIDIVIGVVGSKQGSYQAGGIVGAAGLSVYFCRIVWRDKVATRESPVTCFGSSALRLSHVGGQADIEIVSLEGIVVHEWQASVYHCSLLCGFCFFTIDVACTGWITGRCGIFVQITGRISHQDGELTAQTQTVGDTPIQTKIIGYFIITGMVEAVVEVDFVQWIYLCAASPVELFETAHIIAIFIIQTHIRK